MFVNTFILIAAATLIFGTGLVCKKCSIIKKLLGQLLLATEEVPLTEVVISGKRTIYRFSYCAFRICTWHWKGQFIDILLPGSSGLRLKVIPGKVEWKWIQEVRRLVHSFPRNYTSLAALAYKIPFCEHVLMQESMHTMHYGEVVMGMWKR